MLNYKVPWSIKDVLFVYVMRIAIGFLVAKILFSIIFDNTSFIFEITDRIIVLILIWLVIKKYNSSLRLYGLSLCNAGRNILYGCIGGAIMLTISIFSERIYVSTFLLTPAQHPLIVQVEQAASYKALVKPLFLAGLLAPVTEELFYRMFTFLPLKSRFGVWGGAVISAGIFALLHFNAYWLAELMVVGVGLALLYYWSASLVTTIAAHMVINITKILLVYFNIKFI